MNNFTNPQNYSLEKFKQHSIILPLDNNYNVTSFQKISAKDWKNNFFNTLVEKSQLNFPEKNKKEHLANIENGFKNLINISKVKLHKEEPLLSFAFPIANCWIIVFFSHYFDKSKKIEVSEQIKEVKFDPIEYAYRVTI